MNEFNKKIELFEDYAFECRVAETFEGEVDSVYLYYWSKRFSKLMQELFRDSGGGFDQYLPRKMKKDQDGCLAMASPGVERIDSDNCLFINSGEEIEVSSYYKMVDTLNGPEQLLSHLFDNAKNMVWAIEGYWVYLYLCCEAGWSESDSLKSVRQAKYEKRWGKCKPVDDAILNKFYCKYRQI